MMNFDAIFIREDYVNTWKFTGEEGDYVKIAPLPLVGGRDAG